MKKCHYGCPSPGKIQMCTGCESLYYCSRQCQARHWPSHKTECAPIGGQEKRKRGDFDATIFLNAVINDDIEIVEEQLGEHNADVDTRHPVSGLTALMWAAYNDYTGLVQILLGAGASLDIVDKKGRNALDLAKGNSRRILQQEKPKRLEANSKRLGKAAEEGDIEAVRDLLESNEGININYSDGHKKTALVRAISGEHVDIAKLILDQYGLVVTSEAFIRAVRHDLLDIVELLLEQPEVDINVVDDLGQTALMTATEMGKIDMVKILLAHHGILINQTDEFGSTALTYAFMHVRDPSLKLIIMLIKAGAYAKIREMRNRDAVHVALKVITLESELAEDYERYIRETSKEVWRYKKVLMSESKIRTALAWRWQTKWCRELGNMLKLRALAYIMRVDRSTRDWTKEDLCKWISLALNNEIIDLTEAECVLIEGREKRKKGNFNVELLIQAVRDDNEDGVNEQLDEPNADINKVGQHGSTAIVWALMNNLTHMLRILLEAGASVDVSMVNKAIDFGRLDMVKLLVETGRVDINQPDKSGWTPLMLAIGKDKVEIVEYLLARNVDVNVPNLTSDGNTPLMLAVWNNHIELVRLLLSIGDINVNVQNKWDNTPLTSAIMDGHIDIAKLLLAHPNIQPNHEALMEAVYKNRVEIAELLLRRNEINVNDALADGDTALIYASQYGHVQMLALLLRAGANVEHKNFLKENAMDVAKSDTIRLALKIHIHSAAIRKWASDIAKHTTLSIDPADIIFKRSLQLDWCDNLDRKYVKLDLVALAYIMRMGNLSHLSKEELCDRISEVLASGSTWVTSN